MSPAAHAALGAAIGGRIPRLIVAIPLAFVSHFVLDAIPHFELFFPLAHWLGVSHEAAFWIFAIVCGIAVAPFLLWVTWRNKRGILFAGYCVILTGFLIGYQTPGLLRVAGALAITCGFAVVERSPTFLRWLLCGLATVLPDVLRDFFASLDRLHRWAHFRAANDFGHYFFRWFDGSPAIYVAKRFENAAYMSGYVLEVAIELAIFVIALYLALRWAERPLVSNTTSAQTPEQQI